MLDSYLESRLGFGGVPERFHVIGTLKRPAPSVVEFARETIETFENRWHGALW
jgi:hypothetical protein